MRKYVFTALCGALAVAMFSACGGGSSSAGTPASSNGELFGEVSAAVIESAQKQADFQAKVEKLRKAVMWMRINLPTSRNNLWLYKRK